MNEIAGTEASAGASAGEATEEWLERAIRAGRPHQFQARAPVAHNLLNLGVLALLGAVFVGTLAAAPRLPLPLFLPLGAFVSGTAAYVLFAIVVHEASHGMFLLSADAHRRRRWNRVVGWLCTLPFGVHYERHWEHGHHVHHLRPIEEDDPQRYNRETGGALVRVLVLLLLVPGYPVFHRMTTKRSSGAGGSSRGTLVAFALFWVALAAATGPTLGWAAPFSLFWGLGTLSAWNQLKGALEHGGDIAFEKDARLRSRSSLFPLRQLFPLFWVTTYHFEHHLNYAVPWYELPRYHRAVAPLVPESLRSGLLNRDLFAQLAGRLGRLTGPSPEAAPPRR